jgi:hypothetical protein
MKTVQRKSVAYKIFFVILIKLEQRTGLLKLKLEFQLG